MKRGQISISWVIGIGVSIALAAAGTFAANDNRTDDKVGGVQKEVTIVSERVARLETSIPNIEKDVIIIRDDLRDIKRYLNIK